MGVLFAPAISFYDETLTLLARRTSYAFSAELGGARYDSSRQTILRPSVRDELASLELFETYADREITDCASFTRTRKVRNQFPFDKHFRYAGFEVASA